MRTTIPIFFLLLCLAGCGPSTPDVTPQEKKAFMGGPMPSNFMQNHAAAAGGGPGAAAAAQKAQQQAMAAHGGTSGGQ